MRVFGADSIAVDGKGGLDSAMIIGSRFSDSIVFSSEEFSIISQLGSTRLFRFEEIDFDGNSAVTEFGVIDSIELQNVDTNDVVFGVDNELKAVLDGTTLSARNFVWLEAFSEVGSTAQSDLAAVDFWFDLHGDWNPTD